MCEHLHKVSQICLFAVWRQEPDRVKLGCQWSSVFFFIWFVILLVLRRKWGGIFIFIGHFIPAAEHCWSPHNLVQQWISIRRLPLGLLSWNRPFSQPVGYHELPVTWGTHMFIWAWRIDPVGLWSIDVSCGSRRCRWSCPRCRNLCLPSHTRVLHPLLWGWVQKGRFHPLWWPSHCLRSVRLLLLVFRQAMSCFSWADCSSLVPWEGPQSPSLRCRGLVFAVSAGGGNAVLAWGYWFVDLLSLPRCW